MSHRLLPVLTLLFSFAGLPLLAHAHIALWHPSMYGFNVTAQTFSYDNRPVVPLMYMTFEQWWFHGHLGYPPNDGDVFELPAGGTVTAELACDKGATSYYASSQGGDIQQGDWPCPNQPSTQFHTTGIDDVKGCALAIAQKPNANDVNPDDFVVFSVNQTCVWNRFTDFQIPADMPACPEGGCTCAWFWIHSPDSGSEQMFMTGFHCDVTGARADAPALQTPQLARRCGADPANGVEEATPSNCTQGAKQPLYWLQLEGNNMFEGYYSPPYYNDLYDFKDGAQNNIFVTGSSSSSSSSWSSSSSSYSYTSSSYYAASTSSAYTASATATWSGSGSNDNDSGNGNDYAAGDPTSSSSSWSSSSSSTWSWTPTTTSYYPDPTTSSSSSWSSSWSWSSSAIDTPAAANTFVATSIAQPTTSSNSDTPTDTPTTISTSTSSFSTLLSSTWVSTSISSASPARKSCKTRPRSAKREQRNLHRRKPHTF